MPRKVRDLIRDLAKAGFVDQERAEMKASDRYLKIVEWSQKDRCYVGTCPGLMLGGIHGGDEAAVYAELCTAVEEWIRIHEEDNEPLPSPTAGTQYSGKFVVRVGKELHKKLAVEAVREGVSLNSYCVRRLRGRSNTRRRKNERTRATANDRD